MDRIDRTAVAAVRALIASQPTTSAKVAFAWQIAVGPTLAGAARLAWRDGTLRVVARSEAWRREILRAKPLVVARVDEILGPGVVQSVIVVSEEPATSRPFARPRP